MDFYLGMIFPWAITYEPYGFMLCDGRELSITQNQALYAILGVQYGGNGTTTFKLPDLRGRFPLGATNISQLSGTTPATTTGTATAAFSTNVILTANNIPGHTHTFTGTATTAQLTGGEATITTSIPGTTDTTTGTATNTPNENAIFAVAKTAVAPFTACNIYRTGVTKNVDMCTATSNATVSGNVTVTPAGTISTVGGTATPVTVGGSATITYPYDTVNYLICTMGLFPSRQ